MSELSSNPVHSTKMGVVKLVFVLWAPVALALGSWVYLSMMAADMTIVPGMLPFMMNSTFGIGQFFGLFLMWVVMMAAMMLPSALPMILAYARMRTSDCSSDKMWTYVLPLSLGYVATWAAFSFVATLLHGGLTVASVLSPMGMSIKPNYLAATFLIGAGAYQFTPLKQSCLRQCRSPLGFLMTQWHEGKAGAFIMGWKHGLFCVGCCWALMALLFVVGVMNTLFILALSAYVIVEKAFPFSRIVTAFVGTALILTGLWVFTQ